MVYIVFQNKRQIGYIKILNLNASINCFCEICDISKKLGKKAKQNYRKQKLYKIFNDIKTILL